MKCDLANDPFTFSIKKSKFEENSNKISSLFPKSWIKLVLSDDAYDAFNEIIVFLKQFLRR